MNIINTKNRIMRIHDLKQHIQRMSHENIVQYAENDPIIPLENTKEVMSDNVGYAGTIQNYCTVINVQPDLELDEIPSIIPSQQLARENADYWMEELNPKIINTYTQVKQFCNYYGSLTEKDIDQLVDNINNESGKKDFIAVMNEFQTQSDKNGEQATTVSSQLNNFNTNLAEDLRNFTSIKNEADALYTGENGLIAQLESDMVLYQQVIDKCNTMIAVFATLLTVGAIGIIIGPLLILTGTGITAGIILTTASIAALIAGGIELDQIIKEKQKAQYQYQQTAIELEKTKTQCAVLEILSDNFTSLAEKNQEARNAVLQMVIAWQTIGNNFAGISEMAEKAITTEIQMLIKIQLKAALQDVKDLKVFAETCERNGVLPVIPEAELIYRLRLPQSWLNQAIHGDAFRNYVAAKRKKGFFDRGRRGWRTRDRQICIPLYRTDRC